MGKFDGYLMVSDLDGTLFGNNYQIPKNNIEAIKYFIDSGGLFSIATGRGMVACDALLSELPTNIPGVLFNGAVLYDLNNKKVLKEHGIDNNEAKTLIKLINKKFPDIPTVIFHKRKMYTTIVNDELKILIDKIKMPAEYMPIDEIPFPWYKMLCEGSNNRLLEIKKYIDELNYPMFSYVFTNSTLLEIIKKDVTKAAGLTELTTLLNIEMSKTIAAGDYFNDVELLEKAAISVVPQNAPNEIKQLANYITCSNIDGMIADFIYNFDLQQNFIVN